MGVQAGKRSAQKLVFSLLVILALLGASAATSHAQWSFSAEFKYLEPVGTGFDFSVVQGRNTAISLPSGTLEGIDHGFEPGFRLEAGFDPLYVAWLRYRAEDKFSATCPTTTDCLSFTQGHPDFSLEDGTRASAKSKIGLDIVDLYFRPVLAVTGNLTSHWFVGYRYARLTNKADIEYEEAGDRQTISAKVENDMHGLRAGVDGRYQFPFFPQLGILGMGAVSLLRGTSDLKFSDVLCDPSCIDRVDARLKRDSIVPILEVEARLVWTPIKNLDIWASYEFLHFSNVMTAIEYIDDVHEERAVEIDRNVGFHGFNVGVTWRF